MSNQWRRSLKSTLLKLPFGLGEKIIITKRFLSDSRRFILASPQRFTSATSKIFLDLIARAFKVPNFSVTRIGHLIVEPETYVKEYLLSQGKVPLTLMLASRKDVANKEILKYWQDYFWVVDHPAFVKFLQPLTTHPLIGFNIDHYAAAINSTAKAYSIQTQWADREPLFKLKDSHIEQGRKALFKLGIPEGSWFVCVHCREGGYSTSDEAWHSFRSSRIKYYSLAMDYIISQGGFCIRMGDPTMEPLPKKDGWIDYAHSPERSDWLDLYLSASCRFFLGSCSGAFNMATIFGIPVACANMAPLSSCFPNGEKDIGIPQLYRRIESGQLLSFAEILNSPLGDFRYTVQFKEAGIELVKNSSEEIRDLAIEQFQKISGTYQETNLGEELQNRFKSLFKPGHLTYGSSSRVSSEFLRKYQYLFQSDRV